MNGRVAWREMVWYGMADAVVAVVAVVAYPVSYPNKRPPVATNSPTMMAGAEDPATLSGLCHPMAIAMARSGGTSNQGRAQVVGVEGGSDGVVVIDDDNGELKGRVRRRVLRVPIDREGVGIRG